MKPAPTESSDGHAASIVEPIADRARPTRPWLLRLFVILLVVASIMVRDYMVAYHVLYPKWPKTRAWDLWWYAWVENLCAFLALWLVFGGGRIWIRLAGIVPVLGLLVYATREQFLLVGEWDELAPFLLRIERHSPEQILSRNAMLFAAMALPLVLVRWRHKMRVSTPAMRALSDRQRDSQFTLAQLLLTITVICAALGVLRYAGGFQSQWTYAIAIAAMMHAAIWAVLGGGSLGFRLAIMFGVWIGVDVWIARSAMASITAAGDGPITERLFDYFGYGVYHIDLESLPYKVAAESLLGTAIFTAILAMLRRLGYRLEWLDRSEAKRLASSEASGATADSAVNGPAPTGL